MYMIAYKCPYKEEPADAEHATCLIISKAFRCSLKSS